MKTEKNTNKQKTKCQSCQKEINNDKVFSFTVYTCCSSYNIKLCKECYDKFNKRREQFLSCSC